MSTVELLPDVEGLTSSFLRELVELEPFVGDRVYTSTPNDVGGEPFVLVQRIGGSPTYPHVPVLEPGELQVSVYGGPKRTAHDVVRRIERALSGFYGLVTFGTSSGVVSGCTIGALRYVPDESFEPPRPRYVLDVTVHVKPGA